MGIELPPFSARVVDNDDWDKLASKFYWRENRRRRSIDEEHRDKGQDLKLPTGKFNLNKISLQESWQSIAWENYAESYPLDQPYFCNKCGCQMATGFPPENCPRCGAITIMGRMVADRLWNK